MAFAAFHQKHPNSLLYLHTLTSPVQNGVDIEGLAKSLGILDAVRWSNQYHYLMGFSEPLMAKMYQAFDVLSAASMSEGFGIPIVEAQACGCPVVTTACTSMTELTWAGIAVTEMQPFWTPLGAWVFMPSIEGIARAYEEIYERLQDEPTAQALRATAVAGAQAFRWDRIVAEYWAPLLAEMEAGKSGDRETGKPFGPKPSRAEPGSNGQHEAPTPETTRRVVPQMMEV